MLYVILYFKLRNFVISQFGIRNTVLVIFSKNESAFKCIFITSGGITAGQFGGNAPPKKATRLNPF
jgi:hypothetical protein